MSARLLKTREQRGLTRAQVAKRLGESSRWVWRIETGATRLLADDLPRFAKALGVKVVELVA